MFLFTFFLKIAVLFFLGGGGGELQNFIAQLSFNQVSNFSEVQLLV
jgi:hypothetical protein